MALTVAYLVGLVLVLLGERVLGDTAVTRFALTGGGTALALGAAAWRGGAWARARGERRGVLGWLLAAKLLGVAALLVYAAGAPEVMDRLGVRVADMAARARWRDAASVLWPMPMLASLLALVFCERAYAPMREAKILEARRARLSAAAGLEIALAASFLAVAGFVAAERDLKIDMSYFRTSRPSGSTRAIVASFKEPLTVALFFPPVSEVRAEVEGYARALAQGGRVKVASYDRLASPKIAEEYRVGKDGTLVLARGDKKESLALGVELDSARSKLRTLDRDVQKALLKLAREKRTVYLTSGHGELGEPGLPGPPDAARERPGVATFKKLCESLGLNVKTLTLAQGLGSRVPDDATAVLALGPTMPLLPEEQDSLVRYLATGGRLLLAVDPEEPIDLGPLAGALGVTFAPTLLANDKAHVALRRDTSDHGLLVTNRFSSHASVTTLSRNSRQLATVFFGAGALDKTPGSGKDAPKVDFVVRSLPDTFADGNGNFEYDAASEKRATYNLVAAVSRKVDDAAQGAKAAKSDEKGKGKAAEKPEPAELRALLMADADALGDVALERVLGNLYLAADAVRWLVGEEKYAGEVAQTEEDVKIQHTRKQDVTWFYATIFAVPAIVLAGGLGLALRTRRRRSDAR